EMAGIGVLGVADGGAVGGRADLDAVLSAPAVAALPETGGDVGNFYALLSLCAVAALPKINRDLGDLYTVLICPAVAALPKTQLSHASLSRDVIILWMKSTVLAAVNDA